MLPVRLFAAGVALALGIAAGCQLDLQHRKACGDGYFDPVVETCDFSDPTATYACDTTQEVAICSDQCNLTCTRCGNGQLDDGEDCDPGVPVVKTCVDGSPSVRCNAQCEFDESGCLCGNGRLDPGESCDNGHHAGLTNDFGTLRFCEDIDTTLQFSSGEASCTDHCAWDTASCGLCDNGVFDGSQMIGGRWYDELCDFDVTSGRVMSSEETRLNRCRAICGHLAGRSTRYDCEFGCEDECRSIVPIAEPECCLERGETCSSEVPCCWTKLPGNQDAVDEGENGCDVQLEPGGNWRNVCK